MTKDDWLNIGFDKGIIDCDCGVQVTFLEVYKKWFLMKLNVIKSQSCDRIEVVFNKYYLNDSIIHKNVSVITDDVVIAFFDRIIRGFGNITLREFNRIYQIVNNVLVYARDLNLGGAPLLDWSRVKRFVPLSTLSSSAEVEFAIPKADINNLMNLVIVHDIYPYKRSACLCLCLNFYLGLRIGELASLSWQDFDFDRNVVRIYKTETKTYNRDSSGARDGAMVYRIVEDTKTIYSVREVPLTESALMIIGELRKYHSSCGYTDPYLAYDGEDTILVRSLDRTLRRLCQLCDITYFNSHMIRKTFATMLHVSGMPTRFISDILGHAEMLTTENNYILTYDNNFLELRSYMTSGLDFDFE